MIHFDLPAEIYRQNSALGSTDLKNILKTPAHFRHARFNPPKETDAMRLGTAVHAYLLERQTFFDTYVVEPEGLINKARNPWKADWDSFKKENAHKKILSSSDWQMIKGIYGGIMDHRWAASLMEISQYEVSVLGDELKGRADMFAPDFITDIKTCQDASGMIYEVQDRQYYLQAALYLDLFQAVDGRARQFLWIACEKEPPYCVRVFVATDEMIELGRKEYLAAHEIHKRCVDRNEWPGYDSTIEELHFRPYFKGVLG